MITKADETIRRLQNEGWTYSHEALVNKYLPAGSVSKLKDGRCRVHHGKTVGFYCWQITTVMKRA